MNSRAADRRALGEREQRGQHRRARVQHHAAHVGVVVVEHVAHLAVGERRVEQAELELAAEHGRLRLADGLLQHAEQRRRSVRGRLPASAQPIQSSRPRRASRCAAVGQIAESRRGQMRAQRLGQRDRVGLEVLVHATRRADSAAARW